jgi:hypothetical protein
MSEQPSGILPPHPEVKRSIDIIPVTPYTKDRFLKTITGKIYTDTPSVQEGQTTPQRLGVNLTSSDGMRALRIFLLPRGESENGTIGGILIGDNNGKGDSQPLTQYLIKENPNHEDNSMIVEKRILPPFVDRNSEFPPNIEGAMVEHIQKAFDPPEAEELRARMGHITLEQLGSVLEVTEGEIVDMIDEISVANVKAK